MASVGRGARQKGADAERAVVAWLADELAIPVKRARAGAMIDSGDVAGIYGVVIEIKNQAKIELRQWLLELERERGTADLPLLAVKPRGYTHPRDWYWLVPGDVVPGLIARAAGLACTECGNDEPAAGQVWCLDCLEVADGA